MNNVIKLILSVFLMGFILMSLISYHPVDPEKHNMFGSMGAFISGSLIDLFGVGAFWIALLFVLLSITKLDKAMDIFNFSMGSLLLIVTTSSLLAVGKSHYSLFGSQFTAGGFLGTLFISFLIKCTNTQGTLIILFVLFLISIVLVTNFSFVTSKPEMPKPVPIHIEKVIDTKEMIKENHEIEIDHNPHTEPKTKTEPDTDNSTFELPSLSILNDPPANSGIDKGHLQGQGNQLSKVLNDHNIFGNISNVVPGPVVTTFQYTLDPGIKVNRILNLSEDIAIALKVPSVKILSLPGKGAVGIETPNDKPQPVSFKEMVASVDFKRSPSLSLCLGKDVAGKTVVSHLTEMPHLLIAGATGAGKSVSLNTMICSILYKSTPEKVKMLLIDPKMVELSIYQGIPHLVFPVVTDPKKAAVSLQWAVDEMVERYKRLGSKKVRNIDAYNQHAKEKMPYLVIIIDELADLMLVARNTVEMLLVRLAQMGRAAGIHIILATQRPSKDVLTGLLKANFPTRLTFKVSSKTDSRIIIDKNGAESLLGRGDMLFLPPGTSNLTRIQGAFMSDQEVHSIVDHLKSQQPHELTDVLQKEPSPETKEDVASDEYDDLYDEAVDLVTRKRQASVSLIQRTLRVGYNRAARIVEVMEKEGVVSPLNGNRTRKVLAPKI